MRRPPYLVRSLRGDASARRNSSLARRQRRCVQSVTPTSSRSGYGPGVTPPFLLELPADVPERARRFWEELLGVELEERAPNEGRGRQAEHAGIALGLHERGPGPGDRFALPYFAVPDLPAALDLVRALGGEVVHPGERWAIRRDSEGTPFGLAAARS